jgi:hypothetical protein
VNREIIEAKQAESLTRQSDLAAARCGRLDGNSFALAERCRGLPDAVIHFDAVHTYPLEPAADDDVDDR